VDGTPSWWIFATGSSPSQALFTTQLAPGNIQIALTAAILATALLIGLILLRREKQALILDNVLTNVALTLTVQ
jgi:hypothetical protein